MRRWLAFLIPFFVVLAVGLGVWAWTHGIVGETTTGEAVWVEHGQLDPTVPYVRLSGMAHYDVVVEQVVPGNLFREEQTFYLFPLFEPYDTDSRAIRLMVRTEREPEHLVSYEMMTIEGPVVRATPDVVPYEIEIIMAERSDYYFAEEMLLIQPWTVEEGLDPRAEVDEDEE